MRKLALVLILLTSCASIPIKQRATQSLAGTQQLLIAAQDAERQLCNAAAYAKDPAAPITTCEGPSAAAVQLTTERHRAIARALAQAFDAHVMASVALQAWRAGDPVPTGLSEITAAVREALAVVRQLLPGSSETTLIANRLIEATLQAETAIAALKGER